MLTAALQTTKSQHEKDAYILFWADNKATVSTDGRLIVKASSVFVKTFILTS